jgi:hypothetical protein
VGGGEAEAGGVGGMMPEKHPSGAKAQVRFPDFSARLKSCPFKATSDLRSAGQIRSCPYTAHVVAVEGRG